MAKMQNSSIRLENGVGFSNGCELLALKKPPPLVPNSLMNLLRGHRTLRNGLGW